MPNTRYTGINNQYPKYSGDLIYSHTCSADSNYLSSWYG